jgi:hypothetical protein
LNNIGYIFHTQKQAGIKDNKDIENAGTCVDGAEVILERRMANTDRRAGQNALFTISNGTWGEELITYQASKDAHVWS